MATATLAGGFTYGNVNINSVSPSSGSTVGGTNITINGENFNEYAVAYVGSQPLQNLTVVSSTEITCTTPPWTAGAIDVTVVQIDDSITFSDGFEYIQALTADQVSPNTGVIAGGETVTIYGTGFNGSTTVTFGGTLATNVTLVNSTTIECDIPAKNAGYVDVIVTKGMESVTLSSAFEYILPLSIGYVIPVADFDIGGTSIAIHGYGFDPDAIVTIGGIALENVVVVNNNLITGVVPNGTPGFRDVVATKGVDTYTLTNGFQYIASVQLASITPSTGTFAGGTSVTIDGENFLNNAVVTIGNKPLINQIVVNSTTITGDVPDGPTGTTNVIITQSSVAGLDSDIIVNGFTYSTNPDGIVGPTSIKETYVDILRLNNGLQESLQGISTQTGDVVPIQISKNSVTINKPLTAKIEFNWGPSE